MNDALTQRLAAQTEREAPRWTASVEPVAVSGEPDAHCLRASIGNQSFQIGPDYMETKQEAEFFAKMFLHAIEVGHRASLPAPQQATPEPAHPDDVAVDRFAAAMKAKLAASRAKGRGGWDDPEQCTVEHLARLLVDHIAKGDPVDVANFAMMLHQRGADRSVLAATTPEPVGEVVAWLSTDCIGERYLCFSKPKDSDPVRPLIFGDTHPAPGVSEAWDEGYRQGVQDERTSEANIGIAGFGAEVSPARQNPYRAAAQAKGA